jgi:ABC-2 type transport system permease protein
MTTWTSTVGSFLAPPMLRFRYMLGVAAITARYSAKRSLIAGFAAFRTVFRIWITCCLWRAALAQGSAPNHFSLSQIVTITYFGVILFQFRSPLLVQWVAGRTEAGAFSYDLARPIPFPIELMGRYCGMLVVPVVLVTVGLGLLSTWSLPPLPIDPTRSWLAFATSFALAAALAGLFTICVSLAAARLSYASHAEWLSSALFQIFSGAVVPLSFFPRVFQQASSYLPFRLMAYDPMLVYLDGSRNVGILLLHQAEWLCGLLIIAIALWYYVKDRLQRHGE